MYSLFHALMLLQWIHNFPDHTHTATIIHYFHTARTGYRFA